MSFFRAALVTALLLTSAHSVHAQAPKAKTADAVRQSDLAAYEATMKCFVANGVLAGTRRDVKDAAGVASAEANARRAFDLAVQFGHKLGYSENRINADFGLAQGRDLPKLVNDPAYVRETAATCRALGLM